MAAGLLSIAIICTIQEDARVRGRGIHSLNDINDDGRWSTSDVAFQSLGRRYKGSLSSEYASDRKVRVVQSQRRVVREKKMI